MPSFTATAPGKVILFGEHAVVYGRPAIAAPVTQVRARAVVSADPRAAPGAIQVQAPDIQLDSPLADLPPDHPLAITVFGVLQALMVSRPPAFRLRITSSIPLASGLGSGAAVTAAVARALSAFLGRPLPDESVSALAYEVEKVYHGNPSGIDNTVIAFERPVYFIRGQSIETLRVPAAFTLVIGDTGISSPTAVTVRDVHLGWQAEPARYEGLFDAAGRIAQEARQLIERGNPGALGPLMDENQELLCQMGVSSPELDKLVSAARMAGALGAKLSGGGRGGNMIALVAAEEANRVAQALRAQGASRTIVTTVGENGAAA